MWCYLYEGRSAGRWKRPCGRRICPAFADGGRGAGERKAKLKTQIEELNKNMEAIQRKIKGCAEIREELKVVGDYFRMRAKKYESARDSSSV